MIGDVLVAWQTDTIPYLVLGEDGKGYLKGITDENWVLPVSYEFKNKGALYVQYTGELYEHRSIFLVFKPRWDGVYIYNAEESQGYGRYIFPDGALFYAYDRFQ